MAIVLSGEDLAIERGGRLIAAGLSFKAEQGAALILVGPNGAGKTSLLRAIAGLLPLAGGLLRLEGGNDELTIGEQAHYIGHLNALKPALTVRENLMFWAGFLSADGITQSYRYRRIDAVLDRFLLHPLADIPCGYLSAGQKRRVALARLMAVDRRVWLLDEPTAALDDFMCRLFTDVVDEHLCDGGIVIAATHLPLSFITSEELALGRPPAAEPTTESAA